VFCVDILIISTGMEIVSKNPSIGMKCLQDKIQRTNYRLYRGIVNTVFQCNVSIRRNLFLKLQKFTVQSGQPKYQTPY